MRSELATVQLGRRREHIPLRAWEIHQSNKKSSSKRVQWEEPNDQVKLNQHSLLTRRWVGTVQYVVVHR